MKMSHEKHMNLSIAIADKLPKGSLKVGAVLVSSDDKVLCSSRMQKGCNLSWNTVLISEIKALGINHAATLYVSVNTYNSTLEKFDLEDVLNIIQIDTIYVGLPDPSLTKYVENDPLLTFGQVKRYPDKLQRQILYQNYEIYAASPQAIKNSPYFHDKRISELVMKKLKNSGVSVTREELNGHKSPDRLKQFISEQFGIDFVKADTLVNEAISEAFNEKYGRYKYTNDTRSIDTKWRQKFKTFFKNIANQEIENYTVIDVGVGGGHEATCLFTKCKNITFVDVAIDGLLQIKSSIPSAQIINASADNLEVIENNYYDVYVSLRTYNSSFFDIAKAIAEAKRILKNNAVIVVSVANGFLCTEKKCIIPGLLIPGTEFVDIYRGMEMTQLIKEEYIKVGFKNIQLYPTNTEIYLAGIAA